MSKENENSCQEPIQSSKMKYLDCFFLPNNNNNDDDDDENEIQ